MLVLKETRESWGGKKKSFLFFRCQKALGSRVDAEAPAADGFSSVSTTEMH